VATPRQATYDVVIVGGAIMGASIAWWLSENADFDGSVLVVERDMSFENSSTGRTNSCMRQQFSNEVNIRISQFGAQYVRDFRSWMHNDPDVPELGVDHYGYMYLASTESFASTLRTNQEVQASFGAGTRIMSPEDIARDYPFYNVDDLVCGSHNLVDEGYFDGMTMFDWWRRMARRAGVEYLSNTVVGMDRVGDRIMSVTLATGETVSCGTVVNASGPRASQTAEMAGVDLVVEPRRRYTFIFDSQEKLDRKLPLTIDPSGVHVRDDGLYYLAGCPPDHDQPTEADDFTLDDAVWEDKIWPAIAHRIPAFERVKVIQKWVGHYSFNPLDQNAIVGPHTEVSNFVFANGFSGHGLQQSPAMGRGVAEWISHGEFRSIDLTPLGYDRIVRGQPFLETAII